MRELTLILLMGLVVGCMPDSFTKFNDSTKAGGGVGGAPGAPPIVAPKLMSTPLSTVQHLVHSHDLLLLYVTSATPFSVGGFVSTPNGFVALVKEVDLTKNFLKVKVCGTGVALAGAINDRCNNHDSGYPAATPLLGGGSTASNGINGDIISADPARLSESSLDNEISYFTEQTKITKVVHLIPADTTPFHLTPIANIKSSQEGELSGYIQKPTGATTTLIGIGTSFSTQVQVNDLLIIEGQIRKVTAVTPTTISISNSFLTFYSNNLQYSISRIDSTEYLSSLKIVSSNFSPDLTLVNLLAPDSADANYVGEVANGALNIPNRTLAETKVTLTMTDADFNKASAEFFIQSDTAVPLQKTPLKLTKIQYLAPENTKLILELTTSSMAPFQVNGVVTNADGFIANIDSIDTANKILYVTTCGTSTAARSISTRCKAVLTEARLGYPISNSATKTSESLLDINDTFIAEKATVKTATYLFPTKDATVVTINAMPNLLSSANNEISGKIASIVTGTTINGIGTLFNAEVFEGDQIIIQGVARTVATKIVTPLNSQITVTTPFPAFVTGSNLEYLISKMDNTDYVATTFTNIVSPNPTLLNLGSVPTTGLASILKTVTPITIENPFTTYNLTMTDTLGNTQSTSLNIATSSAPKDLGTYRNVLLNVLSNADFRDGDIITTPTSGSGSGAKGYVQGVFGTNYIEVRVESGTFSEFDNIDNEKIFASQRTFILNKGVIPYNVKIDVAAIANFDDSSVATTIEGTYIFNVANNYTGSVTRGYVSYKSATSLYVLLNKGSIKTGDLLFSGKSPAASTAVNVVTSNQQILTVLTPAMFQTGSFITTHLGIAGPANDRGLGEVTELDAGNLLHVSRYSGVIDNTYTVSNLNPYPTPVTTNTINSVQNENYYILFRNKPASIYFNLKQGSSSAIFTITPSLPTGLILDPAKGIISGAPSINFSKTGYTLTATTPLGTIDHLFSLKVQNYFELSESQNVFSYNIHRGKKSYNNQACRVTADQMANTEALTTGVKDVTCFLDGGEKELYELGAKLKVDAGVGLCNFVSISPMYFYNYYVQKSSEKAADATFVSVTKNLGTNSNPACATEFGVTTNLFQNQNWATIEDDFCIGNYSASGGNGPNCDEGKIEVKEDTFQTGTACLPLACTGYTGTGFYINKAACLAAPGSPAWNTANLSNSTMDKTTCEDSYGTCFSAAPHGPGTVSATNNTSALCSANIGTCDVTDNGIGATLKLSCESSTPTGGVWTNDSTAWVPNTTVFGAFCSKTSFVNSFSCGGSQNSCIDGAGTNIINSTNVVRAGQQKDDPYLGTPIEYILPAPNASGKFSNMSIANYSNKNTACNDPNLYEFDTLTFANYWDKSAPGKSLPGTDPFIGGQPGYIVSCLDAASQPKARIKLFIRDWDQAYTIADSSDVFLPPLKMDSTGLDLFGVPFNNIHDFDSFMGVNPVFAGCGGATNLSANINVTPAANGDASVTTTLVELNKLNTGAVIQFTGETRYYMVKSRSFDSVTPAYSFTLSTPYFKANGTAGTSPATLKMVSGYPFPGDNL